MSAPRKGQRVIRCAAGGERKSILATYRQNDGTRSCRQHLGPAEGKEASK